MPIRLTPEDLQEIEARYASAMQGEYRRQLSESVRDIPALLAEIKALTEERDSLTGKLAVAQGFYDRFDQTAQFIRNRLRRVHRIAEGTNGYKGCDLWMEIEQSIKQSEEAR